MKRFIAVLLVASAGLLAGCAGQGAATGERASGTGSGQSGITVFGTMDAGVSGYKNQSR